MNILKNRIVHPQLRDEESLVIENAVSLAIDSIINVLYSVTSARTHEYQRMVADRDKEIQRLESRSKVVEYELQELRRQGCTCRLLGNDQNLISDVQRGDETLQPVSADNEMTTEQEMSISLGIFARPPSAISIQSQRTAPPLSPSRVGFVEQTFASHSTGISGVSDGARSLSTSPATLKVKEEPSDIDTVLIQWEVSDQNIGEHQGAIGTSCEENQSHCTNRRLDNRERIRKLTEKLYADSDRHGVQQDIHHPSNGKKSVPMSDMPEEAQRLKRAAWRAASRRYYARKVARMRGGPTQSSAHIALNPLRSFSLRPPFGQKSVRTVTSGVPVDTHGLPSEAWRLSSGSSYTPIGKNMAGVQAGPHHTQASESAGVCIGQSHDNTAGLGGIICS